MVKTTKEKLISTLSLVKHQEGGYFRETYRSKDNITTERQGGERSVMTSIFYLLTDDRPICRPTRNKSDIVHHFHAGSAITYFVIDKDEKLHTYKLGLDVSAGEVPQLVVPGGYVKSALLESGEYGLIGETVAPGFEYQDVSMYEADAVRSRFPELWKKVGNYMVDHETLR